MKLIKPKFWDKNHLTIQSIILYPFTLIIKISEILNYFVKSKEYPQIKTICVGNIYLGGTGKTPLVNFLAKKLKKSIIKFNLQSHIVKINSNFASWEKGTHFKSNYC